MLKQSIFPWKNLTNIRKTETKRKSKRLKYGLEFLASLLVIFSATFQLYLGSQIADKIVDS